MDTYHVSYSDISSKYIVIYVASPYGQNRCQYVKHYGVKVFLEKHYGVKLLLEKHYGVKVFLEKHSICLRHEGSQSTAGARA